MFYNHVLKEEGLSFRIDNSYLKAIPKTFIINNLACDLRFPGRLFCTFSL